jgi:hypothetical protein
MPTLAANLRKPILGAYKPDTGGRCVVCARRRLCSAHCRGVARRLRPPKRRVRHTPLAGPASDIAELSATTRHLITLGQAVHGPYWQRPTARDVGVDNKTVWRWTRGEGRPTSDDLRRLVAVARQRRADITAAIEASAYLTYRQPQSAAPEKQFPKKQHATYAVIHGGPPLPPWKQG